MSSALLIIDMINPLDFPGSEKLVKFSLPVARRISKLRESFHKRKAPVIFVNDNFGQWKSNWQEVYEKCSSQEVPGARISRLLKPDKQDYFILKPKHSGFYCSPLEILLEDLRVTKLVVTGLAGNICVLFTVNDVYMRGFKIHVPRNCIASNTQELNQSVIRQFKAVFKLDVRPV